MRKQEYLNSLHFQPRTLTKSFRPGYVSIFSKQANQLSSEIIP